MSKRKIDGIVINNNIPICEECNILSYKSLETRKEGIYKCTYENLIDYSIKNTVCVGCLLHNCLRDDIINYYNYDKFYFLCCDDKKLNDHIFSVILNVTIYHVKYFNLSTWRYLFSKQGCYELYIDICTLKYYNSADLVYKTFFNYISCYLDEKVVIPEKVFESNGFLNYKEPTYVYERDSLNVDHTDCKYFPIAFHSSSFYPKKLIGVVVLHYERIILKRVSNSLNIITSVINLLNVCYKHKKYHAIHSILRNNTIRGVLFKTSAYRDMINNAVEDGDFKFFRILFRNNIPVPKEFIFACIDKNYINIIINFMVTHGDGYVTNYIHPKLGVNIIQYCIMKDNIEFLDVFLNVFMTVSFTCGGDRSEPKSITCGLFTSISCNNIKGLKRLLDHFYFIKGDNFVLDTVFIRYLFSSSKTEHIELVINFLNDIIDKSTNNYSKLVNSKISYINEVMYDKNINIQVPYNNSDNIRNLDNLKLILKTHKKNIPNIHFMNEYSYGVGLLKQMFTSLTNHFSKKLVRDFNGKLYIPRKDKFEKEEIDDMRRLGFFLSLSLIYKHKININLSPVFFKHILSEEIVLEDVFDRDTSNKYINLDMDLLEDMDLYFEYSIKSGNFTITVPLIKDGNNIKVTQDNYNFYVKSVINFRYMDSREEMLEAFKEGFNSNLMYFTGYEKLFRSSDFIEWFKYAPNDQLKNDINYLLYFHDIDEEHKKHFYSYLYTLSNDKVEKLLEFITGKNYIDEDDKEGKEQEKRNIVITKINVNDTMPTSSVCNNILNYPIYSSYSKMKYYFDMALNNFEGSFGFV